MTDNITVTAGSGTTVATDNIAGVNFQRVKFVLGNEGTNDGNVSSSNPMPDNIAQVGGSAISLGQKATSSSFPVALPSGRAVAANTITRAATTPTYALGQQVGPGSATIAAATSNDLPIIFARGRLSKNSTTTASASFRVHWWNASPTLSTDTSTFVPTIANYLGYFDIGAMIGGSDGAAAQGALNGGPVITPPVSGAQTLYYAIEARASYVGVSGEVFTASLEFIQ